LIGLVTNLAYYGRLSTQFTSPAGNHLGVFAIGVPIVGGLVVGLLARYGSAAIRGHGIPDVMERVIHGESRIPARLTILKPLSAAIAIGTGGPFGAEGPIIATGGALGSMFGQLLKVTADERKTLLACGAAAGMSATFGAPLSAVLLSIELLLFEYRPRSLIPVALASATAMGVRIANGGSAPIFSVPMMKAPDDWSLAVYIVIGALIGLIAVGIVRITYFIEDSFAKLPINWMWWPALGGIAVGVIGYFEPRTLGVGYENIIAALAGTTAGVALLVFSVLKFTSWTIAIGSGTSGGTMAPLFTIGAGLGGALGGFAAAAMPGLGIDPRVAALVGMAAMFAAASRAPLTSVLVAFETTRQPLSLLPLLGGCAAGYLISLLLSRHSLMTEKLARKGTPVDHEYAADHLAHVLVREVAESEVETVRADETIGSVRARLEQGFSSHQGFPVLGADGRLVGVITRQDVENRGHSPEVLIRNVLRRPPAVVYEDNTLREAADHMVVERVGRLPVVARDDPFRLIGIISRSDLLGAHGSRIDASRLRQRSRSFSSG
jgi:H+/Cl- antiporter ClcA/CBS domain-containing protein